MIERNPERGEGLEEPDHFCFQVMSKRLQASGQKVQLPTMLFLASLCQTPGDAVMWAYTLCDIAERLNVEFVGLHELTQMFPDGFPTDTARLACWDAQKDSNAPIGNAMDDMTSWRLRNDG